MSEDQLNYVRSQLEAGHTADSIRLTLKQSGYDPTQIVELLQAAQQPSFFSKNRKYLFAVLAIVVGVTTVHIVTNFFLVKENKQVVLSTGEVEEMEETSGILTNKIALEGDEVIEQRKLKLQKQVAQELKVFADIARVHTEKYNTYSGICHVPETLDFAKKMSDLSLGYTCVAWNSTYQIIVTIPENRHVCIDKRNVVYASDEKIEGEFCTDDDQIPEDLKGTLSGGVLKAVDDLNRNTNFAFGITAEAAEGMSTVIISGDIGGLKLGEGVYLKKEIPEDVVVKNMDELLSGFSYSFKPILIFREENSSYDGLCDAIVEEREIDGLTCRSEGEQYLMSMPNPDSSSDTHACMDGSGFVGEINYFVAEGFSCKESYGSENGYEINTLRSAASGSLLGDDHLIKKKLNYVQTYLQAYVNSKKVSDYSGICELELVYDLTELSGSLYGYPVCEAEVGYYAISARMSDAKYYCIDYDKINGGLVVNDRFGGAQDGCR